MLAFFLNNGKIAFEQRTDLTEQIDERVVNKFRRGSFRIKFFFGRLVNVEATCGRSEMEALIFDGDDIQIHQITVQLSRARRRIPAETSPIKTKFYYTSTVMRPDAELALVISTYPLAVSTFSA